MKNIIESVKIEIFAPFYSAYRLYSALFWSVFGPAAQYCFPYPKIAYAE